MASRNWWLGIAATLAVAAGLASAGAHAAALLVALGAAVGWALWGMAATRAACCEHDGEPERRAAARMRLGVMRFLEAHGGEARKVRDQLEQLRTLLGDAAMRLGSSFAEMHALAARQEEIARAMAGGAGTVRVEAAANEDLDAQDSSARATAERLEGADPSALAAPADELSAVSRDLERTVCDAVTALQFQDIASQLVGHAVERVEALDRMAGKLERLPDASLDELGQALAGAQPFRDASPVSQRQMTRGAVELF